MSSTSEPRDFTKCDELSDVTIIVENTPLYVHRQYLAEWSAVWRRVFIEECSGNPGVAMEIILEDKKLEEVKELLHCIYSSQKPISEQNVGFLLQFGEELQMPSMMTRCEDFLLSAEMSLDVLILAEKYGLKTLYKRCIEFAKTRTMEDLERSPVYKDVSESTLIKVYKEKIDMMRDYANDLKQSENKLKHRADQLSDEKAGMISVFQNIGKMWDMPNKRCYKHMTEEKFDYTCLDCNQKMQREIRRMCHDGQHVRRFYKVNNAKT